MPRDSNRPLPRAFKLHWGEGQIVEEATCESKYHEPSIQLLEFDDKTIEVRFCYYNLEGQFQRSPLIVGEDEIKALRLALQKTPRLKKLLERLINS